MCWSSNVSDSYTMHVIILLDNLDAPSTQSAQQCWSLYFVGLTTSYSWAWGCNIHCWVFLHILEMVDIIIQVGRCSCNWTIWLSGVQLKCHIGKEATWPWKVLLRSFSPLSVYWILMVWNSVMIPLLALVYSILQSSPKCSTDIAQWNGWQ